MPERATLEGGRKFCSRCGKRKPADLDHFGLDRKAAHGLTSWCRECQRDPTDRKREQRRTHRRRLKAIVRAAKNKPCAKCDFQDSPTRMHFHHIDPSTKEATVCSLAMHGASIDRILAEIAKCEVWCETCHMAYHDGMLY